jgi:hypothetical protein
MLLLPSLLWLGIWSPAPVGLDAVSAVTPGHVSVVGAAAVSAEGAPETATEADLVQGAMYMSGGLHKAIDPASDWILVRPGHVPMEPRAVAQHVNVVAAVVAQLADIAPQAQISLLLGGVEGTDVSAPKGLKLALGALADDPEMAKTRLEVLDLATEEVEEVEVPDGGVGADLYPMPISLLECDAVVNVARLAGPLSGLANLEGLAGMVGGDPAGRRIDLALLAEVDYSLLDMLGHSGPQGAMILAGQDPIAVDRVAIALLGAGSEVVAPLAVAGERMLGMSILTNIKVGGLDVAGTWAPPPDTTAVD